MIMFIFGLVVLVVNNFVDFNFMSSNYLKKECWIVGWQEVKECSQEASFHDRVRLTRRILGEDRERKVEKRGAM